MLYTRFSKSTITSKAPTCIPLIKDLFFYLYLKYVLKERPITLEKVIFWGGFSGSSDDKEPACSV